MKSYPSRESDHWVNTNHMLKHLVKGLSQGALHQAGLNPWIFPMFPSSNAIYIFHPGTTMLYNLYCILFVVRWDCVVLQMGNWGRERPAPVTNTRGVARVLPHPYRVCALVAKVAIPCCSSIWGCGHCAAVAGRATSGVGRPCNCRNRQGLFESP